MFVPLFWLIMMIAFTAIAVWESIRDTWHPIVLWMDLLDWAGWEMCEGCGDEPWTTESEDMVKLCGKCAKLPD
jgi:hypothetical protein